MKYFFLIAAFNALFFAVIIKQRKNAIHDKVLITWLSYLGVYVGIYALFSDVLFTGYPLLSAAFISLLMLHGPFLYLYIVSLTNNKYKCKTKEFIHFIPFVLFNLYLIGASFFPDYAEKIRLDHIDHEHGTTIFFNTLLILTVLSGPVYFVLSNRLFKKLDFNIFNNFSTSEKVNLDWLRKLVYTFGFVWTILMIFTTIHHIFNLFSWSFCTDGLFLSLSVFIILIGYFGLKQKEIFTQPPNRDIEYFTGPATKYANMLLKETEAVKYISQLKQYMELKKPYLNADLTLPQLANDLQIPSHHLSRVINEKLNMNFFDFINQYRVEETKAKMKNREFDHLTILGIAFDSGFNTKSAFNRVFKKMTGMTPSEYKESRK